MRLRKPSTYYWPSAGIVACFLSLLPLMTAHADPEAADNLLRHARLIAAQGVRRASALTDGKALPEGGPWQTKLSAVLADGDAYASFDLGQVRPIRAVQLQADHNDVYRVEVSDDGRAFRELWDARPTLRFGMQTRWAGDLHERARYVRLRAFGGDGEFVVSELMLFEQPTHAPVEPMRRLATPLDRRLRDRTLLFALCMLAPLLLPRRSHWALRAAAYVVPLVGIGELVRGLYDAWPAQSREVSLIRAAVAFVAAIAVARDALWGRRYAPPRAAVLSVLGLCAPLSLLAFYNMGHPQFYDAHSSRWVFAHYLDLRQYYPTAKYFRELGYTGIYDADLAAQLEHEGKHALVELGELSVRDLDSLRVVPAVQRANAVAATRARFSPERWAQYTHDAAWFRDAMGESGYLETLVDYGGNATPMWIAIAHVLFEWVPPGDRAFTALGLLDLVLIVGALSAIFFCFGPRTALVCAVIFGANDFVMYGTNWAGATLRHDWLAYLALGACALKRERFALGGALLALASLIRAFPAVAFVGIAVGPVWRTGLRIARERRVPPLRALLRDERVVVRIAAGALVALLLGVLFSMVVLGHDAWPQWWSKVVHLENDPHPAHVALRRLLAGWQQQATVLHARRAVYYCVLGAYIGALALAARNKRPEQAAVLGLLLVPALFAPANYYIHLVYLLPLIVAEQRAPDGSHWVEAQDARIWLALLWMCALQYFTVLEPDLSLHFYFSTVLLFGCLSAILWCLLRADAPLSQWLSRRYARREREG